MAEDQCNKIVTGLILSVEPTIASGLNTKKTNSTLLTANPTSHLSPLPETRILDPNLYD